MSTSDLDYCRFLSQYVRVELQEDETASACLSKGSRCDGQPCRFVVGAEGEDPFAAGDG